MALRRDQVFKLSSGFVGRPANCYRSAKTKVIKALQYAYRDRRAKKREIRSTFISQINAGTRLHGLSYSDFIHGLIKNDIHLNRKVLADLAVNEPYSFQSLVKTVQNTTPTRDTDLKRLKDFPEKLQFMPISWETFKESVKLSDRLHEAAKTSDWNAQLQTFFVDAHAKAREQNIKDFQEGQYKIIRPRFRMSAEERKEYAEDMAAHKEKLAKMKEAAKA